MKNILLLSLRQ